METKNLWRGVKTVVSHPAVTGALQGALAAYVTDVAKRRSRKGGALLAGIGIGVVVGGGLVLLFATQGGKELRAKLMNAADKAPSREGKGDGEIRQEISKPDGVPTNSHTKYRAGEPTTS